MFSVAVSPSALVAAMISGSLLAETVGVPVVHQRLGTWTVIAASLLLAQLGLIDEEETQQGGVEDAILAETRLSAEQRQALIAVYRSYLASAGVG